MKTTIATHSLKEPSPRCLLNYIQTRYPDVVAEAKEQFIPLKYPFDLMYSIRDFCEQHLSDMQDYRFTRRDVAIGAIVLMYSKVPVGAARRHYLHQGVLKHACFVFDMMTPNFSNDADKANSYIRTLPDFKVLSEWVRDNVLIQTAA